MSGKKTPLTQEQKERIQALYCGVESATTKQIAARLRVPLPQVVGFVMRNRLTVQRGPAFRASPSSPSSPPMKLRSKNASTRRGPIPTEDQRRVHSAVVTYAMKSIKRHKPAAPIDPAVAAQQIAEHIAAHGITYCPPRFVTASPQAALAR